MKDKSLSRREFLRGSAVVAGATGMVIGSGLLGEAESLAQETEESAVLPAESPESLEHRQAVAVRDSNWATLMSKVSEEV